MENQAVFLIKDFFEIQNKGLVVVGILESGEISTGMWGDVEGIKVKVLEIECFNEKLETIKSPANLSLRLEKIKKESLKRDISVIFNK